MTGGRESGQNKEDRSEQVTFNMIGILVAKQHLGKVNAKGVHIKAIKEAGKRFTKPGQAFVYKLEVHHVCLEIGHGIRKLGKSRL